MKTLAGRVALVTGASRGIGQGIAQALGAAGAKVVVNYRSHAQEAEAVAASIREAGSDALVWQADVADRAAAKRMIDAAVEHFGRLDIAVANAAHSIREPVIEAKWENVLRTIEVTQFGVFHTCQFAAQQMVAQPRQEGTARGKIIVISSIHEELAFPGSAAYNMSKAAINHLVRTMAAELAPQQINVNAINPGWIDTPGERAFYSEEELRAGGAHIPWGRMGTIEDIGHAAAYLASDAADYVTGTTLRVDGGFMVGLNLP